MMNQALAAPAAQAIRKADLEETTTMTGAHQKATGTRMLVRNLGRSYANTKTQSRTTTSKNSS